MSWRVVAASAVGTSHTLTGTGCQDSCYAQIEVNPLKPPILTIFVADGAGSALRGRDGAELAMEAAAAFVSQEYRKAEDFCLTDQIAVECVQAVRAKIYEEADRRGSKARDYACTFLGVLACPDALLLMQIGDGGIVVDTGSGLTVPITPMVGEYVNMTKFVTDEDAIDVLSVVLLHARPEKVAVFSDGIQRLALNMSNNTAHTPFFSPFFSVLAKSTTDQEDYLQAQLENFLNSTAVNERTDDDKTLALAHWVE
jgi:hypothetical protein